MGTDRLLGSPFQANSGSINLASVKAFQLKRCLPQYQGRDFLSPSLKYPWSVPSHCCNFNMATKYMIIALWLSDHILINFWMLWNMGSNDTDFEKVNNSLSSSLSSKSILISFRSWKSCHKTTLKDSRVIWIHYLIISVLCQSTGNLTRSTKCTYFTVNYLKKINNFFKQTKVKCRRN